MIKYYYGSVAAIWSDFVQEASLPRFAKRHKSRGMGPGAWEA